MQKWLHQHNPGDGSEETLAEAVDLIADPHAWGLLWRAPRHPTGAIPSKEDEKNIPISSHGPEFTSMTKVMTRTIVKASAAGE